MHSYETAGLEIEAQPEFYFPRRSDRENAGPSTCSNRVRACVDASHRSIDGPVSSSQSAESPEIHEIEHVEE